MKLIRGTKEHRPLGKPRISNNKEFEIGMIDVGQEDVIEVNPKFYNTIFINGDIDHVSATAFYKALHYLKTEDPVFIVLNTNGGNLHSAISIRNMIKHLRSKTKVYTFCVGVAFSAGALLLASGTKGCRFAVPMSQMMMHTVQLSGFGMGNYRTEIKPLMQSVADLEEDFMAVLAEEITKNSKEVVSEKKLRKNSKLIENHFHRGDIYLRTDQAIEIGLIDEVGIIELPTVQYEGLEDLLNLTEEEEND